MNQDASRVRCVRTANATVIGELIAAPHLPKPAAQAAWRFFVCVMWFATKVSPQRQQEVGTARRVLLLNFQTVHAPRLSQTVCLGARLAVATAILRLSVKFRL